MAAGRGGGSAGPVSAAMGMPRRRRSSASSAVVAMPAAPGRVDRVAPGCEGGAAAAAAWAWAWAWAWGAGWARASGAAGTLASGGRVRDLAWERGSAGGVGAVDGERWGASRRGLVWAGA
ncbi:hypothetical protein FRACA_1320012 [Frankia canadensis]|uniref:Uncharacterized protein n=1 Tax=Frankia canadensis TaxID=1836972 RepID=A0A2I2KKS9_9ACTN|nr:hypothetical protein FRACA_1320012 [Frankia canadensis]SOU53571.1 hypothetical protein FRACA_1320012 [Frankia canadensis]